MSGMENKPSPRGPSAVDFADASRIAAVGVPGKDRLTEPHGVSSPWIERGAACDDKPAAGGCFLQEAQRGRLVADFMDRVQTAQTNYKIAIVELKVARLVEKDDDLSWVLGLVLDTVSAHCVTALGRALNRFKNGSTFAGTLSDKTVEVYAKNGFDVVKKQASSRMKGEQNSDRRDDRKLTLSYLDELEAQCDVGFAGFKDRARAFSNDAELIVLWDGMDPLQHTVGQYEQALAAKVSRFKKSGVPDIGQRTVPGRDFREAPTFQSRRVVWLRGESGTRTLYFQSATSHSMSPWGDERTELERVPEEFVDAAVAHGEAAWGPVPTFDDPAQRLVRDMGFQWEPM